MDLLLHIKTKQISEIKIHLNNYLTGAGEHKFTMSILVLRKRAHFTSVSSLNLRN